jgi:hypothetical protein
VEAAVQAVSRRPRAAAAAARLAAERPVLAAVLATAALACALWAVYGSGSVGYDQLYSLLWGDELAEGSSPGYEEPRAPTPHPLSNLAGLALAPLGDGALPALEALSLVSFAALGLAAFSLGRRLAGAAVGALFAALLLTRPTLVNQALIASIDVPFLALILAAAAVEARRPRAGVPVLLVLAVAGLLRPEAWLIATAYTLLLLLRDAGARERAKLVALTVAAPLLWMASDVAITGDPFWTFHQARATSERLADAERYGDGGPVATVEWVGRSWTGLLQPVPAIASAAALAICATLWRRRLAIPLALLGFGIAGFLAIGIAGLPLLSRYFFIPAAMLCLLLAVAVLAWRELPAAGRARAPARAAGVALGVALAAYVPLLVNHMDGALTKLDRTQRLQDDLLSIAEEPHVRELMAACQPIQTRLFRARPTLLWELRDDARPRIVATRELELSEGVLLVYALEERPPAAHGFTPVARNRSWTVLARCPRG